MKFRDRIARFMEGRYGADQFSRFLSFAPLALLLISLLISSLGNGIVSNILWYIALAALIYGTFRMFSRNIYKRQAENAAYLKLKNRFTGFFRRLWQRIKDCKDYKYFRCPKCKASLRVPRRKGKVQVTCKKCGEKFMGQT